MPAPNSEKFTGALKAYFHTSNTKCYFIKEGRTRLCLPRLDILLDFLNGGYYESGLREKNPFSGVEIEEQTLRRAELCSTVLYCALGGQWATWRNGPKWKEIFRGIQQIRLWLDRF
eukprot:788486-Pyramimonas_sp.AAC.1